jgi:hypothetical protein
MALSGIQLSAGIVVGVNKPVDGKYGPYPDVATAKADIGVTLRYLGLTVGIETGGVVEEYWWESGTADGDLVAKGGSTAWGSITGTLSSQTDLQSALDGKVDENAAITGDTKTKITYDAKGLVTGGADATTADIADSADKRYVTDAQLTVIGNTSGTNTGDNATNSQYSGLEAAKQDVITGGASSITSTDLTASRALVSDGSGKVAVSDVTSTELGYLDGVTSAVQTQLNDKIAKSTGTTYNVYTLSALTQAEYDAIVTPDADTIYFII